MSAPGGRAGEWCPVKAVKAGGGSGPASGALSRRKGRQGCAAAGSRAQGDISVGRRQRGGQLVQCAGTHVLHGASCTRRAGGSALRVSRRSLARPPPRFVMLHGAKHERSSCQAFPTGGVTVRPGNAFIEGRAKAMQRATRPQHVIGVERRRQPASGPEREPPRDCRRQWHCVRRRAGRRAPQT